jgi:hypothetical protein
VTPGGLFSFVRSWNEKTTGEPESVCPWFAIWRLMLSSMPADLYPGQTAENKSRTKSKNR